MCLSVVLVSSLWNGWDSKIVAEVSVSVAENARSVASNSIV